MNCKDVVKNIRQELEDYIIEHKLQSLIIGISGGIDSTLCAALARPVCDCLHISLIGRSIPIATNSEVEIQRAALTGVAFCHDFKEIDLSHTYRQIAPIIVDDYDTADHSDVAFKIRLGNLKARMRMIKLYDLAAQNKGMVLSTDNYTEFLLGFSTIMGDWGDYGMIQHLWKTEVYEISKFILKNMLLDEKQIESLKLCIEAVPTDGLGVSNSDLDQLGAPTYDDVDKILKCWIMTENNYLTNIDAITEQRDRLKDHPVVQRYLKANFKRHWPISISRTALFKKINFKRHWPISK